MGVCKRYVMSPWPFNIFMFGALCEMGVGWDDRTELLKLGGTIRKFNSYHMRTRMFF